MTEEELIDFCLTMPGSCVRYPYGNTPMVISTPTVHEFCEIYEGTSPLHIVLKCDPQLAIRLREKYSAVQPGFKCNKKHWNSVFIDGTIPDDEIRRMIVHSFELMMRYKQKKTLIFFKNLLN